MAQDFAIPFPVRQRGAPASVERVDEPAIVGSSDVLKTVMYRVEQVAPTNATVLLLGETGTGKELLARAIHHRSPRCNRGFVVVDCGALPASLIESELFGRERGAFTGAHTSQAGRFEAAHGGTIFLDEIGELPLELQPKLLRVLQDGCVERLGSLRSSRVDVRIIAATNRNLAEEVRCGRFRRDLFYRLNVFPITLPTLRQRIEDLPDLIRFFADRLGRELGRPIDSIAPGSIAALQHYDWPGNIRELENVLLQAIVLSRDGVMDLREFVGEPLDAPAPPMRVAERVRPLADAERDHMTFVLEHAAWRIEGPRGAARMLGLQPSTMRAKMRKLGILRPPKAGTGETGELRPT